MCLYISCNILTKGITDIRYTSTYIHDVNISTKFTYSLNSIYKFSCNRLHFFLLSLLKSLLVVLVCLLNLLVHCLKISLSFLLLCCIHCRLCLVILLTLTCQFILHGLEQLRDDPEGSEAQAKALLNKHKLERLLVVNDAGVADQPIIAPRLKTLAEVKGKALMVHVGGDNMADSPQPLGGGGGRFACGVIK